MNNLLGRTVAFIPCFMYKKDFHNDRDNSIKPVRGVITYIHPRHGWFRAAYPAGDTTQHECFKLVDIGKDVTLIGKRC